MVITLLILNLVATIVCALSIRAVITNRKPFETDNATKAHIAPPSIKFTIDPNDLTAIEQDDEFYLAQERLERARLRMIEINPHLST